MSYISFSPQWLTAQIPAFLLTLSERVKLSMGTLHLAVSCSMTATPDITCLVHPCSPASQWATGTNLSQNALVKWTFLSNTLMGHLLYILVFVIR